MCQDFESRTTPRLDRLKRYMRFSAYCGRSRREEGGGISSFKKKK
jgi:hypothetical protein